MAIEAGHLWTIHLLSAWANYSNNSLHFGYHTDTLTLTLRHWCKKWSVRSTDVSGRLFSQSAIRLEFSYPTPNFTDRRLFRERSRFPVQSVSITRIYQLAPGTCMILIIFLLPKLCWFFIGPKTRCILTSKWSVRCLLCFDMAWQRLICTWL